ncbi:SH3 domain-containing protein [Niabella sp. W65]|nr:SH3 domain-containing protein [Niabella sp. W65]MCH7362016.1 SH3 domain-containing protein [Niabella sp. W65]ULT45771.1 SH3 domain-containing protein [Niabella sp. I65]
MLLPFVGIAQTKTWYNWKGYPLEVFERPDRKSRQIGTLGKGSKVEVVEFDSNARHFPIYLCYYGDTVTTRSEQYTDNDKHVYTLRSDWAKVVYNNKVGYVPAAFLVHIPIRPIHKKKDIR